MYSRKLELVVGIFVILAVLCFVVLAVKVSGVGDFNLGPHYTITAEFDNIGNLKVGAPVKIGGVKVGMVTALDLDVQTFRARATMFIQDTHKNIPLDSAASIYTQGLLGSNFIAVSPGFAEQSIKDGGALRTTHSAMILEKLIGQLLYSSKSKTSGGQQKEKV